MLAGQNTVLRVAYGVFGSYRQSPIRTKGAQYIRIIVLGGFHDFNLRVLQRFRFAPPLSQLLRKNLVDCHLSAVIKHFPQVG